MKILLAAAALVASVLAQELDWDLINKGPQPIPEAYKATDYSEQLLSLGFADVVDLGQAAVNAPSNCNGVDTYMGGTFFANTAFDILLCAVACINKTLYDQANPPAGLSAPRTCQFFNAFLLLKNGVVQGQFCSAYTQTWNQTYATNVGQWRGQDQYTIAQSFAVSNRTNPGLCCSLGSGTTDCGGSSCVDLQSDSQNCGSCRQVCGVGSQCSNGTCAAFPTSSTGPTITTTGSYINPPGTSTTANSISITGGPPVQLAPTSVPGVDPKGTSVLQPQPTAQLFYAASPTNNTGGNGTANQAPVVRLNMTFGLPSIVLDQSTRITSIQCNPDSLSATFTDSTAYNFAKDEWKALLATSPSLLLITAAAGCSDDGQNTYLNANTVSWTDGSLTINAAGTFMAAAELIQNLHVDFGSIEYPIAQVPPGCSSPAGPIVAGLPAVACGEGFDQALDQAIGFYPSDAAHLNATWAALAPTVPLNSLILQELSYDVPPWYFLTQNVLPAFENAISQVAAGSLNKTQQAAGSVVQSSPKAANTTGSLTNTIVSGSIGGGGFDFPFNLQVPSRSMSDTPWGKGVQLYGWTPDQGSPAATYAQNVLQKIKGVLLGDPQAGVAVYCVNCSVNGSFRVSGTFAASSSQGLTEASLTYIGNAEASMNLAVDALALYAFSSRATMLSYGVPGFTIPGVVTVSPEISLGVAVNASVGSLGQFQGEFDFDWPLLQAEYDASHFSYSGAMFSGWQPNISAQVDVAGTISALLDFAFPLTLTFHINTTVGNVTKQVAQVEQPGVQAMTNWTWQASNLSSSSFSSSSSVGSGQNQGLDAANCQGVQYQVVPTNQLYLNLTDLYYPQGLSQISSWTGPNLLEGCQIIQIPGITDQDPTSSFSSSSSPAATSSSNPTPTSSSPLNISSTLPVVFPSNSTISSTAPTLSSASGTDSITMPSTSTSSFSSASSFTATTSSTSTSSSVTTSSSPPTPSSSSSINTTATLPSTSSGNPHSTPASSPSSSSTATPTGGPTSCDSVSCPGSNGTQCVSYTGTYQINCQFSFQGRQLGSSMCMASFALCISECSRSGNLCNSVWYRPNVSCGKFGGTNNCILMYEADPNAMGEPGWGAIVVDAGGGGGGGGGGGVGFGAHIPAITGTASSARPPTTSILTTDVIVSAASSSYGDNDSSDNVTVPVNITDATGQLVLLPAANGNLFVATAAQAATPQLVQLTNASTLAAGAGHVFADSQGRVLYFYPAVMNQTRVSRLRLGVPGTIALGAQLLTLAPFPTTGTVEGGGGSNGTTILLALDAYVNLYYPVVCGLQAQRLNKVFLVRDPQAGVAALNGGDPDLLYTVAGGVAYNCSAMAFVAQGLLPLQQFVDKLTGP